MSTYPTPIAAYTDLEKLSEDEFVSVNNPGRMGNTQIIAYGGCTIAIGVSAACHTVDPRYHIYSSNGNYLGPAQIDRNYYCKVTRIRDTRTFATRFVEVSQKLDDGSKRTCMTILADFQVAEPATMLTYSGPPTRPVAALDVCLSQDEYQEFMVREQGVARKALDFQMETFRLMASTFESRQDPNSMIDQTLWGAANHLPTSQDHLALTDRTTTGWFRTRGPPLETQSQNVSALAFFVDAALSFMPLVHSHLGMQDAGACSSLDFAIRYFSNDVDLSRWHHKELKTHHGSNGRTYSETRIWDERMNLVACMTQMNILRPKPEKQKASL